MIKTNEIKKRHRILIVDDQELNRDILETILEDEYELCFAENGKEALECMQQDVDNLSLVMLDLIMPVMDGLTATETIRALEREDAREIPIIAMTANVFDEDVERSFKAGMNAHLSKPIEPDKIFETLAELIKK